MRKRAPFGADLIVSKAERITAPASLIRYLSKGCACIGPMLSSRTSHSACCLISYDGLQVAQAHDPDLALQFGLQFADIVTLESGADHAGKDGHDHEGGSVRTLIRASGAVANMAAIAASVRRVRLATKPLVSIVSATA